MSNKIHPYPVTFNFIDTFLAAIETSQIPLIIIPEEYQKAAAIFQIHADRIQELADPTISQALTRRLHAGNNLKDIFKDRSNAYIGTPFGYVVCHSDAIRRKRPDFLCALSNYRGYPKKSILTCRGTGRYGI